MEKNSIYRGIANIFWRFLASCGGVGYLPGAPGTYGSALGAAVVWFAASRYGFSWQRDYLAFCWVLLLMAVACGIAIAEKARNAMGDDPDPPPIIVDEFLGQIVTFFLVPPTARAVVLGFFLFRFFDIIKPYPVHKMEELGGGLGIILDDLGAALYSNITLWCGIWLYQLVRMLLNA